MEIYNNNISPVVKEKVSIQKNSTSKTVESKTVEANSLNALASYGMAQVNSCSFKGKIDSSEIDVPPESRLNIINLLGITDKDEIKKLINITGFQFALACAFLYIGADVDSIENELGEKIEDVQEKENEELVQYVKKSKDFLIDNPQDVIDFVKYMHEKNVSFDDKCSIATVLITINEDSLPFAKELLNDDSKKYGVKQLSDIMPAYTKETGDVIKQILNEPEDKFPEEDKTSILRFLTPENVTLAQELIEMKNSKYNTRQFGGILQGTNEHTIDFVRKVLADDTLNYNAEDLTKIIRTFKKENLIVAQKLLYNQNQEYNTDEIVNILYHVNEENQSLALDLVTDTSENRFKPKDIAPILFTAKGQTFDFVQKLIKQNDNYDNREKSQILSTYTLNDKNQSIAQRLINFKGDKRISADTISDIILKTSFDDIKIDIANHLIDLYEKDEIKLEDYIGIINLAQEDNIELINKMLDMPKEKRFNPDVMCKIIQATINYRGWDYINKPEIDKVKLDFAKYLVDLSQNSDIDINEYCQTVEEAEVETVELMKKMLEAPKDKRYSYNDMHEIICATKDYSAFNENDSKKSLVNKDKIAFAMLFAQNSFGFDKYTLRNLISSPNREKREFAIDVIQSFDKTLTDEEIKNIIYKYNSYNNNSEKISELQKLIKLFKEGEIPKEYLFTIINEENKITLQDVRQLERIMGKDIVKTLTPDELVCAVQFKDVCNKQNINEIPINKKKDVLRKLVASNTGLFNISEKLRKYFPLLPKTQEEYCTLLPALVRSLGIETNTLSEEEVSVFNTALISLADTLKNMSDSEYANIQISQEYPKSEFIKDAFSIVKDLTPQERQKVYDYFGFELHHNPKGTQVDDNPRHSFSITGYPVNLNNGKKLAQITDPNTKAVVEELREKVIKFSQNNKILCNNSQIKLLLNNIVRTFPELRTQIERVQHGAHQYDIMKHSLKVMQKIVQNPEFDKLSESHKKVMLICALFHDGNKTEGFTDKIHAEESAFDAFYIINKLNLPKEEKIKIYSLIKHHEWLGYVNNNTLYTLPVEKKQQSVAFDLQYDNLFDMAKLFTIADLKSVKKDDEFYDKFKNDFETHSKEINANIQELKKTQPIMPVTPIPKASQINEAITQVNADGSTNFKGVYKDKNGMIIIKYNEVENDTWEKIGFPKGSISRGIDALGLSSVQGELKSTEEVNTGNIKFFVHGLDFSNQLAKFDAFALPDSDALLSVSYAERPESKYRFFRTQGVLLNTPTKYMHGGGETDAGSGCGKNLDIFKQDYIFGGYRESDRKYISNLIKEALNMTDEEYIKFVKENVDKPFTSIEPEEVRNTIIKAFSTINSNTRRGNRAYNEMYITNPEVMGVFAYPPVDNVGNIMQFIDNQPEFLKQYALEKDLPFVVFGD